MAPVGSSNNRDQGKEANSNALEWLIDVISSGLTVEINVSQEKALAQST